MENGSNTSYFEIIISEIRAITNNYYSRITNDLKDLHESLLAKRLKGGSYFSLAGKYIQKFIPGYVDEVTETIDKLLFDLNAIIQEPQWQIIEDTLKESGRSLFDAYLLANNKKMLHSMIAGSDILKNCTIGNLDNSVQREITILKAKMYERNKRYENEEKNITNFNGSLFRIERNTYETINMIKSMWQTLDQVYNNMGRISQRSTRENLEITNLVNKYIKLIDSKQLDKETKISMFFDGLPVEVALEVTIIAGKLLLGVPL